MGQVELPSLKQEPSFIRFDLCIEKIDLDPYVVIANNYGNRKRLILALGWAIFRLYLDEKTMMVKNACVLIETEVRHIQTGPQVTLYDYHLPADRQETGFHGFKR